MRPRTLLILALLVVALGAFVWFYERELPSSDERREQADLVLDLEADAVHAVRLERGDTTLVIERDRDAAAGREDEAEPGDGEPASPQTEQPWRLIEPLLYRADADAVDRLLGDLAALEAERWIDDPDRAALGLESPRATIELSTDAESTTRLLVGAALPGYSTMVVQRDGSARAAVVSDALWSQLERPVDEWRDAALLPADREAIRSIEWWAGGELVRLARRGERFRLVEPYEDVADPDRVETLLGDLASTWVEEFLPAAAAEEIRGAEGGRRIAVGLEGRDEPVRILLGPAGEEGGPRAVLEGATPVVLPAGVFQDLDAAPEAWRSRQATELASYEIDRLTVDRPRGGLTLERRDGRFYRGDDEIAYETAMGLLDSVTGLTAERVAGPEEIGLPESAQMTIRLGAESGGEVLRVFAAQAEGTPVTVEGRDAVLLLPRNQIDELRRTLDEVATAAPLPAEDPEPEPTG